MDTPQPNFAFRVLDYGCGPGGYTIVAARLVGESGRVYAPDIHPLAVKMVQRKAAKQGLANIEPITSDCATGLPDGQVDVALLYDVLHELSEPDSVLQELHRILKPGGVLSVSDHHMKVDEIIRLVTPGGWFQLAERGKRTISFAKSV